MLTLRSKLGKWSSQHPRTARALALLWHPYVLYLVVTAIVFWPDGLNIGPDNDGWRDLSAGPSHFGPFGPRVFGDLPKVLGLHLVNDGFQGWELVLLALIALRGMLFYEIIKRLFTGFPVLALCCGLIALFHPADAVYFWMDSIGLDFAFVLALAACLAALVHMQTGSRESLVCLLFFMFMTCFTYTAFQPLILSFAVGVWVLYRVEGIKVSVPRVAGAFLPILACIGYQVMLVKMGGGRDGQISDFDLHHVLGGYPDEVALFWEGVSGFFDQSIPPHLALALLSAVCAYGVAAKMQAASVAAPAPRPLRFYAVAAVGLLLLAVASYLPFSVSLVRIGNQRQLFAAGIFIFTLVLLPLYVGLFPRLNRHAGFAFVGLVALMATVMGIENRAMYVSVYRVNEQLLAALAQAVPHPPKGAFIVVHVNRPMQVSELAGLYNRRLNFNGALQFMYHDPDLYGAFTDIYQAPFKFEPDGLRVMQRPPWEAPPLAPYDRLIIVDYPAKGPARVLDRAWLQQFAPKGADLSAYKPGDYGSAPGPGAAICTMFEKKFRPTYCLR